MTSKTSKETDAVGADETEPDETEAEETAPKPAAKRKRRVRVIEVLDDEDLDEVLESLDEEEAEEAPAPKRKPAARKPKIVEPEVEDDEEEDEEEEPAPKAKAKVKPKPKPAAKASAPAASAEPTFFGMPRMVATVVVVVLVALLASLALWQWRSASSATGKEEARAEVTKRATEFGDLATSYNASNYQSQMDKIQKLMTGDLLERYKAQTVTSLATAFKSSPNAALTSKTKQVFVGGVDGKFATAVVSVDITVSDGKNTSSVPQSLIRLALVKEDGQWKVSQMNASGDDGTGSSGGTPLPNVPSTSPSPSPSKSKD